MIEWIMYFGIGFLFAALIGVVVIPLIHARAVRLTIRRLEDSIPQSMTEIQADKDLLRAEFAVSTRRHEMNIEQLKHKTASQLAELGKKGDVINRLKIERDAQNVETILLKAKIEALKEQLTAASKEVTSVKSEHHESNFASLVPRDWPTAELVTAPTPSSQNSTLNDQRRENDVASLVLQWPTTEEARSDGLADAGRGSSNQRIGMAREASGTSGVLPVEPSIHVSPNDQIAHERLLNGKQTFRSLARFFIAALVGVGATFVLRLYGDEAKEMIRSWAPPLSQLLSASTMKSPQAPASAAAVTSPELVQQLDAMTNDVADMRNRVEQFAAKQEQAGQNIETLQPVEKDIKQKMSSLAPQTQPKLSPVPETRPTTIPGWMLREVVNGTAVLQGPNGVWRVTRGDTVPGVGRVDSIVLWGNRWIVATSSGLISTP
ncbi:MAG: hypothetical protein WBW99_06110 [Pseudolabrys sp.]